MPYFWNTFVIAVNRVTEISIIPEFSFFEKYDLEGLFSTTFKFIFELYLFPLMRLADYPFLKELAFFRYCTCSSFVVHLLHLIFETMLLNI